MVEKVTGYNINTLVIDFTGELEFSDNQQLSKIIYADYSNNIFNFIRPHLNDDIKKILNCVKNGETIIWDKEKQLFMNNFECKAIKFSPFYNHKSEIKYVSITILMIENNHFKNPKINKNRFEYLFNTAKDAIFVTDIEGNYIEVNQTAIDRTGLSRTEFLKVNIKDTPTKNPNQISENYLYELSVLGESTNFINYVNSKGNIIETEISGKKIILDGQEALLHISREISGRNQQHAENLDSIIQSEEKERSAFAYEINEIMGPNLSLVKMYIETYFKSTDAKIKEDMITKINIAIDNSLEGVTMLSNRISPHILKNLGLKIALEVFIKKMQDTSKMKLNFDLKIPDNIADNIAIVSYRAVTEILKNINKHSNALEVTINAKSRNNYIIFDINDNGIGFDIVQVLESKNYKGIYNITNKVKSIRGTIDITSKPGIGTHVKIEIPNNEETKN